MEGNNESVDHEGGQALLRSVQMSKTCRQKELIAWCSDNPECYDLTVASKPQ